MDTEEAAAIRFNLVDEEWIPYTMGETMHSVGISANAEQVMSEPPRLGLRDALVHAHEIKALDHTSPLVTISLYRLLLAVLYRVHGSIDEYSWQFLWNQGAWDSEKVDSYVAAYRERFDLFSESYPFYQVRSYGECESKPIALLVHELSSGHNATLFDHTTPTRSRSLSPAEAACYLVAHQAYGLGGTVSLEKGAPKKDKHADAGPLVPGAVVLARGRTLFETLLLNLCRYPTSRDSIGDLPAWERNDDTRPDRRHPDGYVDLLTWQSRRIRLVPFRDDQGRVMVDRAKIMKGYQFTPEFQRSEIERMMAYRLSMGQNARGDAFPPVAFKTDRALWRDSTALLESVGDYNKRESSKRPETLDWLESVNIEDLVAPLERVPLDVFGVRLWSAGGSLRFWRHERLPLPLAYLHKDKIELFAALAQGINMAERVGRAVRQSAQKLAALLLDPMTEEGEDKVRDENKGRPRKLKDDIPKRAATLGMERTYWSRLNSPFNQLLLTLPTCEQDDGTYGSIGLRSWWARTLQQAARDAFEAGARGLDTSPRLLKAVATAENTCRREVDKAIERWVQSQQKAR